MIKEEIIKEKGSKKYYVNGKLHREDGPAVERSDGINDWCLNGKVYGMEISNGDGTYTYYFGTESICSKEKFQIKILEKSLRDELKINKIEKKRKI